MPRSHTHSRRVGIALMVAVATGSVGETAAQPPEISPSILVMYAEDLARCPDQVAKAQRLLPSGAINFVPHLFYRNDGSGQLVEFCQRFDRFETCSPVHDAYLAKWQRGWERCFAAAVARGLGVAVLPHLDGADAASSWRNTVSFDPGQPYGDATVGAYSYRAAMLEPLIAALERALRPRSFVHFALQGEMGRTLFDHPGAYLDLVRSTERRLGAAAPAEVGISVNFNKINGNQAMLWFEESDDGRARHAAMRRLLTEIDFLGISAYRWTHARPMPEDFEDAVRHFRLEWSYRDLPLPRGLPLVFSEFGVGGGWGGNDGRRPARSALEAALHPWSGIYGPYVAATDPWQTPELRVYRRQFFEALVAFLSADGPAPSVARLFLWNVNSWDVLGLFPGMEPYRDDVIGSLLRAHNQRARRPASSLPDPASGRP